MKYSVVSDWVRNSTAYTRVVMCPYKHKITANVGWQLIPVAVVTLVLSDANCAIFKSYRKYAKAIAKICRSWFGSHAKPVVQTELVIGRKAVSKVSKQTNKVFSSMLLCEHMTKITGKNQFAFKHCTIKFYSIKSCLDSIYIYSSRKLTKYHRGKPKIS